MRTSRVLDRSGDTEVDFHSVSQLTAIGALADEVVGDLIRVDAGMLRGSDSLAVKRASDLFGAAAAAADEEISSGLWDDNGIPNALRLLAAEPAVARIAPSNDGNAWVADLAHDLSAVANDAATSEMIVRLEGWFTSIAAATLGASTEALRQRGYASSWLTA